MKKLLLIFAFLTVATATCFPTLQTTSTAQERKLEDAPQWKKKLLEKDVNYENFACRKEDAEAVATYFKEHPPKDYLLICHNDCPVIKCKPVVPFPAAGKSARIPSTFSIHVLVNEKGRTIYAHPLSGHPLFYSTIKKAACDTEFREYERPHQGVMHFVIDTYDFIEVPNRANEVS